MLLIIATSFHLIYTVSRIFHLAHASIIASSAYFVFFFEDELSMPFQLAVLLAIVSSTILGILCEIIIYSKMRKRNVPLLAYLIASIGLYVMLQNCISLYFGNDTIVVNKAEVQIGHQIFGAYITTVQLITIGVSFLLFLSVYILLHFTTTGKSIRAVACNPDLCNIYGISASNIIFIAFLIGSAMAAISGILTAMDTDITPYFSFNLLLYGVVVMIIGGVGSTRGLILGSLLVGTAQHLSAYYIDTKWMDAITYIILILFLIWRPYGFSGNRLRKVEI